MKEYSRRDNGQRFWACLRLWDSTLSRWQRRPSSFLAWLSCSSRVHPFAIQPILYSEYGVSVACVAKFLLISPAPVRQVYDGLLISIGVDQRIRLHKDTVYLLCISTESSSRNSALECQLLMHKCHEIVLLAIILAFGRTSPTLLCGKCLLQDKEMVDRIARTSYRGYLRAHARSTS